MGVIGQPWGRSVRGGVFAEVGIGTGTQLLY